MRKRLIMFLSLLMISALSVSFGGLSVQDVSANQQYPMSCSGTYELAWVNDSGGFSKENCYNSFQEAKNALNSKGDDYVIRHDSSLSPTKIIAINSGIAYSYPKRSSSNTTLNIIQNVDNIYRKTTYVTQHRELAMPETLSYTGSGSGILSINLLGFDGTVELRDVDLIPMKFISKGLKITIGGNTSDDLEKPFTIIPRQSYFEVKQNGNYVDLVYHYFSGWALDGYTAAYTSSIGPASDWMKTGDIYYSYDHTSYYSDRNYKNYVNDYYSYYQFLPARSTTSISASTFDTYMNNLGFTSKPSSNNYYSLNYDESQLVSEGQTFINHQNTYGVNALLVYSLACLESGNGRSQYAVERNNLFGWNAVDSDPDQASHFSSISQGIKEQMAYNLRNYLDVQNAVFFGMHFGNKSSGFNVKYAADPYWGIKVAATAYSIDKLDNQNDGTLTDYNKYDIGIVEPYKTPVYKNSDGSYLIHTTEYGATYQKNYSVILLENMASGYTKTQLANMYINGNLIQSFSGSSGAYPATAYDFNRDIGYISSNAIKVITSNKIEVPEGTVAQGEFVLDVSEVTLYDQMLQIVGQAYQPGIYLNKIDDLTQSLVFINQQDDSETIFDMTNVKLGPEHYQYGGFIVGNIDISQFTQGSYQLVVDTKHSTYDERTPLAYDIDAIYSQKGYDYHLYMKDDVLTLDVSERILNIEHAYNTLLSSATISDNGILSVSGIAMVEGYNNTQNQIKHELVIIDANSDKKVVEPTLLTSHTGDYDLSLGFNHDLDYSYGWYKGDFDLTTLENGEYSLMIQTTIHDEVYSRKVYANSSFEDVNYQPMNNRYVTLNKQYSMSNRLDITIDNYQLDVTESKLPSIKESYSYINKIDLNEDTMNLTINGSAFIWKASFSKNDKVSYELKLINTTSSDIYTYTSLGLDALPNDFSWDNNIEVGGDYDLTRTWFEFDVDISELIDGNYKSYLIIKSNDLVSIIDLTAKTNIGLPSYVSEDESQLINIRKSIDRNRILLDVKGLHIESGLSDNDDSNNQLNAEVTDDPSNNEEKTNEDALTSVKE